MASTKRINLEPKKPVEGIPDNIKQEIKEEEKTKKELYEYINSPKHYQQDDGKETWERMVDKWGEENTALWCEITAFKYQDRMGKKPDENIEREQGKIEWYLNKAKELREIVGKKKWF